MIGIFPCMLQVRSRARSSGYSCQCRHIAAIQAWSSSQHTKRVVAGLPNLGLAFACCTYVTGSYLPAAAVHDSATHLASQHEYLQRSSPTHAVTTLPSAVVPLLLAALHMAGESASQKQLSLVLRASILQLTQQPAITAAGQLVAQPLCQFVWSLQY